MVPQCVPSHGSAHGLHGPEEVWAMHLSCSRPSPAFDTGSWDSALYRGAVQASLQNSLRLWCSPCSKSTSPERVDSSPDLTGSVASSVLRMLCSPDVTFQPTHRPASGGQGCCRHCGDVQNTAGALHSWSIRAHVVCMGAGHPSACLVHPCACGRGEDAAEVHLQHLVHLGSSKLMLYAIHVHGGC